MPDTNAPLPLDRILLLLETRRYDLAEKELRLALVNEPNHFLPHSLLALTLIKLDRKQDALVEAQTAIHLAPEQAYVHYVHASVLDEVNRFSDAERAIREAIRLEPENDTYWSLLSSLHLQRERWQDALDAADKALALDAEDVQAANLRAQALVKLGRRLESGNTLDSAMLRDPENAHTHANRGWLELEKNNPYAAMEHFREALRLEPTSQWARAGILNALRARNPIYRVLLQYFLWMSRLSSQTRMAVIVGGYIGSRIIGDIWARINNNIILVWVLGALLVAYVLFAYLTWTGNSIFNLLLRLDPFGRLVLSEEEVRTSNLVGGLLALAIVCVVGSYLVEVPALFPSGLAAALLVIPVSATFNREPGRSRTILLVYTIGLALLAIAAAATFFVDVEAAATLSGFFLFGVFIFSWLANIVRR